MTAAAVSNGIVPPRPAWRQLLWIVPLTALIYGQPIIPASGVSTTAIRPMTFGLIGIGVWLGLTPGQHHTTWLAVMIPYTHWMAVTWSGGINVVFRSGTRLPALPFRMFRASAPTLIPVRWPLLLSCQARSCCTRRRCAS